MLNAAAPLEYHQVDDLKTGSVTRELLPGAFRRPRAAAAAALEPPPKSLPLPTTLAKAEASPLWSLIQDAMELEIKGKFINNQAWDIVARTPNLRIIRVNLRARRWLHLQGQGSLRAGMARGRESTTPRSSRRPPSHATASASSAR